MRGTNSTVFMGTACSFLRVPQSDTNCMVLSGLLQTVPTYRMRQTLLPYNCVCTQGKKFCGSSKSGIWAFLLHAEGCSGSFRAR